MTNDEPKRSLLGVPESLERLWRTGPMWIASDRHLARFVARPLAAFLRVEASGGILLLAAALIALVWVNSPWSDAYHALWAIELDLRIGSFVLEGDLRHWVNDALMVLFFLVVGLEIKYELVAGELRNPRAAVVPIVAAFAGMVVPASIYAAFNAGGPGSPGWGIPMATDIAFAVGVLSLLGRRIPSPARIFLLTLAIVDDIGAIAVIAFFYTDDLSLEWLAAAGVGVLAVVALRLLRVWSMVPYVLLGVAIWLAIYESGVHATIAGVIMGLLAPAKPLLDSTYARDYARESAADELDADEVRRLRFLVSESISVSERVQRTLHPWSSYVVLPIFALANAGVALGGGALGEALNSPITIGVALGLVLGKTVGVCGSTWLTVRLGFGQLPTGVGWGIIAGLAVVAGVGFTVSLFVTGLAFDGGTAPAADAKVGILGGSLVAALVGAAILFVVTRGTPVPTGTGGDDTKD